MISPEFARQMPKVELHVHLEGSIRPETVLKLAERNGVSLPANTIEGLRNWYVFRDFPHFVDIYVAVSGCVKTADDVELIAREFLQGQAEQNVLHTEATYTASTIERINGIPWPEQLAALQRARDYARDDLNISANFVLDIVRGESPERAEEIARWAVEAQGKGVCALGLSGVEESVPATQYARAFEIAREAGLAIAPHAGETKGPESIWEALDVAFASRIGHGVRCIEDPKLVVALRERGIPLEVCPSSNVCLGVYPSLEEHPVARLLDEGLVVTINSDDPPMFNTTISDEFQRVSETFELDPDILWSLSLNAANAAFLSVDDRRELVRRMREEWPEE